MAARLHELELQNDRAARDIAALRVDLNAEASRLNAIVDYYETRIDRIYARLSKGVADQTAGAIQIEMESDVDDRIMKQFGASLNVPLSVETLPMDTILSNRLKPGEIASPLTLQGFRLNRQRGRELGDRIQVFAASNASSSGVVVYGPYKSLTPGRYVLEAHIAPAPTLALVRSGAIALDVYSAGENAVVGKARLSAKQFVEATTLAVEFEWLPSHSASPAEFRVHQRAKMPFDLMGFTLKALPSGD